MLPAPRSVLSTGDIAPVGNGEICLGTKEIFVFGREKAGDEHQQEALPSSAKRRRCRHKRALRTYSSMLEEQHRPCGDCTMGTVNSLHCWYNCDAGYITDAQRGDATCCGAYERLGRWSR